MAGRLSRKVPVYSGLSTTVLMQASVCVVATLNNDALHCHGILTEVSYFRETRDILQSEQAQRGQPRFTPRMDANPTGSRCVRQVVAGCNASFPTCGRNPCTRSHPFSRLETHGAHPPSEEFRRTVVRAEDKSSSPVRLDAQRPRFESFHWTNA